MSVDDFCFIVRFTVESIEDFLSLYLAGKMTKTHITESDCEVLEFCGFKVPFKVKSDTTVCKEVMTVCLTSMKMFGPNKSEVPILRFLNHYWVKNHI